MTQDQSEGQGSTRGDSAEAARRFDRIDYVVLVCTGVVAAIGLVFAFTNPERLLGYVGLLITFVGMVVTIGSTPKSQRRVGYIWSLSLGFAGLLLAGVGLLVFA